MLDKEKTLLERVSFWAPSDVTKEYISFALLQSVSGSQKEFRKYFIVEGDKKASLMRWVEQMGCLPSEALKDNFEVKEDYISKEIEEELETIETINRYHALFNEDYLKLQDYIAKNQALPNIILGNHYPNLKLLPLETLELKDQKNITIINVPLLALPRDIGEMSQLTEFVCYKTHLKTLPSSVFKFQNLETFSVQRNEFDEITLEKLRIFNRRRK